MLVDFEDHKYSKFALCWFTAKLLPWTIAKEARLCKFNRMDCVSLMQCYYYGDMTL